METLIKVNKLCKYFKIDKGHTLKAVDNVSFDVRKGETLGIVGESGCGKTTLGRTVLGLYTADSGSVEYLGTNIYTGSASEKKELKKKMQIILQNPYSSLNPRMTAAEIICEGLDAGGFSKDKQKREDEVCRLLEIVGLNVDYRSRYPHEFSGGQRQRIGIARTLAVNPEFIVCDEPISALDVSIQAQIVNLFSKLQKEFGLTYLFIAHDLAMIRYISDRIGVMYAGVMVELAESQELYTNPLHPYTKALLSAIPSTDIEHPMNERRIRMEGEVKGPINPGPGCRFAGRCSYTCDRCFNETPAFSEIETGHFVACHLFNNKK